MRGIDEDIAKCLQSILTSSQNASRPVNINVWLMYSKFNAVLNLL
jgi:hypothetical protein